MTPKNPPGRELAVAAAQVAGVATALFVTKMPDTHLQPLLDHDAVTA